MIFETAPCSHHVAAHYVGAPEVDAQVVAAGEALTGPHSGSSITPAYTHAPTREGRSS